MNANNDVAVETTSFALDRFGRRRGKLPLIPPFILGATSLQALVIVSVEKHLRHMVAVL